MSAFPEIEPYQVFQLPCSGGHRIYVECCGNPQGVPALVMHGGPGSGCTSQHRRLFDPLVYNIVLFDQRGCGRSLPNAAASLQALENNTTDDLIDDVEMIRTHLDIERWIVFGGSWGSTLALTYAERFPSMVIALILAGVTTTTRREIEWLYGHVAQMLPEAFDRLQQCADTKATGLGIVEAYARLLTSNDPSVADHAAENWCRWERSVIETDPKALPSKRWDDPSFRLCFARLVTHYFRHLAWLEDRSIIDNAPCIESIPAILINSRFDLSAPLQTAHQMSQRMPASQLWIVEGGVHGATGPGMRDMVVRATDFFARLST